MKKTKQFTVKVRHPKETGSKYRLFYERSCDFEGKTYKLKLKKPNLASMFNRCQICDIGLEYMEKIRD